MNYIVFDLEFNQGYDSPLKQEIFDIGAVKLNEKLEIIDTFQQKVKPQIHKRLDRRTKKVIKITQEEFSQGIPFKKAITKFRKWIGNDYVLCSWALDDINELINNCNFFHLDIDWIDRFIDAQELYCGDKQVGLTNAILQLRIPFRLDFHEALNDAMYTVKVLQKINPPNLVPAIKTQVYLNEMENKRNEKKILIQQMSKLKLHCPQCGRYVKKEKEIQFKKGYIAKTICSNCDLKVKYFISLKYTENKTPEFFIKTRIRENIEI